LLLPRMSTTVIGGRRATNCSHSSRGHLPIVDALHRSSGQAPRHHYPPVDDRFLRRPASVRLRCHA
jgi:hypothetical protein